MIKLIATDMDGTLLGSDLLISDENRKAILTAQEEGIEVVISTGRSFDFATYPVEKAGIKCPYIVMNGAQIYTIEGKLLTSISLNHTLVKEIVEILEENGVYYEFYTSHGHFSVNLSKAEEILTKVLQKQNHLLDSIEKAIEFIKKRFKNGQISVVDDHNEVTNQDHIEIYKLIVFSTDSEKLVKVKDILERNQELAISSSGPGNLEINHVSAQKGNALERYAKHVGFKIEETMAIGDSLNDASMLKKAGFSVAMGNASSDIKALADYVTLTNDENGFAKAVYKVLEMNRAKKVL